MNELRTARLRLSRPQPADWPDFLAMHQDPLVMATLGGARSAGELRGWFDRLMARWEEHGYGWWIARHLESGAFAGRGGLTRVVVEGRDEVEVGYGFLPELWGRGFATELARESIRQGFDNLRLADLVSFTQVTNLASRRVMEKVGFTYERDFVYANLPHVLYRQRNPQVPSHLA